MVFASLAAGRFARTMGFSLLGVALAFAGNAFGQSTQSTRAARQAAAAAAAAQQPAPAVAQANTGPNAITQALQKAGVRKCSDQVQKITEFLSKNGRMGIVTFPAIANVDESLISISGELQTGSVLTYVSANFSPRSDGCSAEYEQVTHWQNTCDEVYAAQYSNLKAAGVLQASVKVYSNTPSTRVMMVPSGPSCVVIKKEVIH
jgi:hypothetical protein